MQAFLFLALMASQVLANDLVLEAYGISPANPPPNSPLARRAVDEACFQSVLSKLMPPTPAATALNDWATSELEAFGAPQCTVTAPAALSEDYMSYRSVVATWLETVEEEAKKITTNCGADKLTLSFSQYCTESQTVIFTDEATATETAVLPTVNVPTGSIFFGSGVRPGGAVGVVATVAIVLGAYIAM